MQLELDANTPDPKTRLMRQACHECPTAQCGVIHMFTRNKCAPSYALNEYQMPPRREKQKIIPILYPFEEPLLSSAQGKA